MSNNCSIFMTMDEFCDQLNIGKNTAYKLLNSGQIHAFRIGRQWKIPKNAVEEFVNDKCSMTKPFVINS